MANFQQVTPFLHVPDVDEAVRFFTDLLSFRAYIHERDYAYVHREKTVGFRILKRSDEDCPFPQPNGYSYYIDIVSMDDLLEELGPKLKLLPADDVRGPVDQPWGQRELMIRTPDGHLLVFGQALAQQG